MLDHESIVQSARGVAVVSKGGGGSVWVARVVKTDKGAPKYVKRRVNVQLKTWYYPANVSIMSWNRTRDSLSSIAD